MTVSIDAAIQVPMQQLIDELAEVRGWGPDKARFSTNGVSCTAHRCLHQILSYLGEQRLHTYTHNELVTGSIREHRVANHLRPERLYGIYI